MAGRRQRSAALKARKVIANTADISMSQLRREATEEMTRASLSREPPSSPSNNGSLRLTVKASSSKLKAATSMKPSGTRGVAQPVNVNSRDKFVGGEILDGKRSRNVKKSYVVESDSEAEDEEMEDAEDDDVVEDDAEDDDVVEEDAIGSDEDADDDADGDVNMDAHPPAPRIRTSNEGTAKPTIHVRPQPAKKDVRTVEQKETADSDDELSELESGMEDETMQVDEEEDAEGDEEEIEVEDEVDEDEEDLDSDDGTPAGASRGSTPDLSKLTRRQRARFEEGGSGHLMALPDGKSAMSPLYAR
jgi:Ino eighty subunit 2